MNQMYLFLFALNFIRILIFVRGHLDEIQGKGLNSFSFIFHPHENDIKIEKYKQESKLNYKKNINKDHLVKSQPDDVYSKIQPNKTNDLNKKYIELDNYNYDGNKLKLYIEIIICTDYSIYKLHESILNNYLLNTEYDDQLIINHIKAYYMQIINGVNERYKMSFKNDKDLSISVNVVDFFISTKPEDSPWTELPKYNLGYNEDNNRIVNAHDVLIDFNSWLELNRDSLAHYDHAFAVTAYDIRNNNTNNDYNGLGYISGICKHFYMGSLIEERGAYTSIRSFAHELGHSIGAEHDENTECNEWDNYLMASNFHAYNRNNSWIFSPCSLKSIKSYLSVYGNHACLLNQPQSNKEFESYTRLYPGQIYNSFEQCKQLYGPNSLPCFEFKSSICETLYCRKNIFDEECHWIAPAAEGTSCDEKKWCQGGKCVESIEAPFSDCYDDTVMWIESSLHNNKRKSFTCAEGIEFLAKKSGKSVLEICSMYQDICCKTCKRIETMIVNNIQTVNYESIDYNYYNSKPIKPKTKFKECKYNINDSVCNIAYGNNYCRKKSLDKGEQFNEWCKKKCKKCN